AGRRGWRSQALCLNDDPAQKEIERGGRRIALQGFGRAKIPFVFAAIRNAARSNVVLAAHPYLALPARLMKLRNSAVKTIVISHGIEVWSTLTELRRRSLLAADLLLAPSTFTAEKLETVQGADPRRIRRLPWPVSSQMLQLAGNTGQLATPSG